MISSVLSYDVREIAYLEFYNYKSRDVLGYVGLSHSFIGLSTTR